MAHSSFMVLVARIKVQILILVDSFVFAVSRLQVLVLPFQQLMMLISSTSFNCSVIDRFLHISPAHGISQRGVSQVRIQMLMHCQVVCSLLEPKLYLFRIQELKEIYYCEVIISLLMSSLCHLLLFVWPGRYWPTRSFRNGLLDQDSQADQVIGFY